MPEWWNGLHRRLLDLEQSSNLSTYEKCESKTLVQSFPIKRVDTVIGNPATERRINNLGNGLSF